MPETALDTAIHSLQVRFGSQALTRAAALPAPLPWPTGMEAVDRMSGIGGLPRGRLAVLVGAGSCGKLSLGLALLAAATREFAQAVVIDPQKSFDPWALLPLRPEWGALTVVRPPDPASFGESALALARAGAGFLLVLGLLPESALESLEPNTSRSGTVVVAVVEATRPALAHASSLSLGLEPAGWIHERGQLVGLRARMRCLKNRVAAPLGMAELEVRYPLGASRFLVPITLPSGETLVPLPSGEGREGLWSSAG
ncbi:MAG TPA: hypothetical protein VK131_03070 [Candidatus Acidoferrales bacterium]|nr:hypothetical protein [Candidatus Acidoferrales bacterium]